MYDFSDLVSTIPAIGTFAFAALRILPKLSSFGTYRMHLMNILPQVEAVFEFLKDTTYDKMNNVSFEIKKDTITAIVGPSGSGKSTIIDLLLRLYDVDESGIYIDNINIKEYEIKSFLEKVGFVSQETFIYISESIVQEAINKVSKQCTTLIIAHRLSTIQNADRIYVLDQGKIVESGTHSQLMNEKGKYWELYNIQKG